MKLHGCRILPFRGFGTSTELHLSGRVLRRSNDPPVVERFETDEVVGARVRVRAAEHSTELTTDDEGQYRGLLGLAEPLTAPRAWHEVALELLDGDEVVTRQVGEVLVPPPNAAFGVISDIDDTIVVTHADHPIKKLTRIFLADAKERVPFAGVAPFYRALQGSALQANPIFYVSSSPWNLHEVFDEAFRLYDVPHGPMFFKDFGVDEGKVGKEGHDEHKLGWIGRLLETYPTLPFVLSGDCGQSDPKIYAMVVERFPGRIRAVYLRSLGHQKRRDVVEGVEAIRKRGVAAVVFDETPEAAAHAAEVSLISADAAAMVR